MSKLIFLDSDGVIAPMGYNFSDSGLETGSVEWEAAVLNRGNVEILNRLIADTGAKVVVSSAWRIGRLTKHLQAILEAAGFKGEVVGRTESSPGSRMQQILNWIRDAESFGFEIGEFVIFDDEDLSAGGMSAQLFFVRVNPATGLTENELYKARRILTQNGE